MLDNIKGNREALLARFCSSNAEDSYPILPDHACSFINWFIDKDATETPVEEGVKKHRLSHGSALKARTGAPHRSV